MVSAQWFAHNKYLMHKPLNHPVSWLYTTITTRRDRNFTSELTQSYYVGHPRQLSTTKTQHNNNTENNNNIFDQHFTNAYLRHPRLLTINQHVSKGPYWQKGTGSALELKGWHRCHGWTQEPWCVCVCVCVCAHARACGASPAIDLVMIKWHWYHLIHTNKSISNCFSNNW